MIGNMMKNYTSCHNMKYLYTIYNNATAYTSTAY